jgi:tetratricopeptide (TPR) repeat protein
LNKKKNKIFRERLTAVLTKYCSAAFLKSTRIKLDSIRAIEKKLADRARKRERIRVEQGVIEENFIYQIIAECRSQLTARNLLGLIIDVATLCVDFGEYATAESLYTEAVGTADREKHNSNWTAEALQKRADVFIRQARWDSAKKDLDKSRQLFIKGKNEVGIAKIENSFGIFMAQQGKAREGIIHFRKAASIFEEASKTDLASTTYMNLGILATITGNYDDALTAYERALPEFEHEGDILKLAELHHNLGMLFLARLESVSAIEHFDESLVYAHQAHYEELIGLASLGNATAYAREKDLALALWFDNKALSIFRKLNAQLSIADAYKVKGIIQRELKQYAAAELYFKTSINLNEGHKSPLNLAETHFELGLLYKETGDGAKAKRNFQQSLKYFQQVGAKKDIERAKDAMHTLEK